MNDECNNEPSTSWWQNSVNYVFNFNNNSKAVNETKIARPPDKGDFEVIKWMLAKNSG